ncbi:MAG: imidazole glycerol phosphate synthase cyclase subunit [Ferrovibrio sp.]
MAKLRLIPTMLLAQRRLVKGRRFSDHEDAGNPVTTAKIYNDQMADEIAVLDIEATPSGREPDLAVLQDMTRRCFVPVAFGGGISSVALAKRVLRAGADKVIINSAALENPGFIGELAVQFGRQAVVIAIDFLDLPAGPRVASACGTHATSWHPVEWAKEASRHGAGEILLTSVDREGSRGGLNLSLTKAVSEAVTIPVIASRSAICR